MLADDDEYLSSAVLVSTQLVPVPVAVEKDNGAYSSLF